MRNGSPIRDPMKFLVASDKVRSAFIVYNSSGVLMGRLNEEDNKRHSMQSMHFKGCSAPN